MREWDQGSLPGRPRPIFPSGLARIIGAQGTILFEAVAMHKGNCLKQLVRMGATNIVATVRAKVQHIADSDASAIPIMGIQTNPLELAKGVTQHTSNVNEISQPERGSRNSSTQG